MMQTQYDLPLTPLQHVLGFDTSEQTYDLLEFKDQIILDLLMAGWNQTQIAMVMNLSQPTISTRHKRIRYSLANSKLRWVLEMRMG